MSSGALAAAAPAAPPPGKGPPVEIRTDIKHDVSPPLRTLRPAPPAREPGGKEVRRVLPVVPGTPLDPARQDVVGATAAPTAGSSFEGLGAGLPGFTVNAAPPDTDGDVGPNHYFQMVNSGIAIFDKASGSVVYGPVPTNTLWSGFGGGCQTNNDGDGTVKYDRIAGRWIVSQFSVSTTPYLQCVAVSTSSDPTGSYYRYAFSYGNVAFPDYPKLGVWPDGYYTTYNIFNNGIFFAGAKVCAFDRASMLAGSSATQQCFNTSSAYGGLLPSDLDGSTLPPSGSPDYLLEFGTNSLNLWRFHVDWATPGNSTFTGPITIPVAAFSPACSGGGTCIPQYGTSNRLDSLGDRLMYRLAYRNFGDHESLVANDSVTVGSSVGIRWYELRNPGGTPFVYQQSTYAPDSNYRWMGSMAMDGSGDIALGYSVSSATMRPAIRYTGRLASDPLNTMGSETTLTSGVGSQTGTLHRWGDYSSMSVDPSDDCTFWYTTEYLTVNGTFNWHTRIGSFRFPGCGGSPPPPPPPPPPPSNDFSISSSPGSVSVTQGGSGTSTISTGLVSGSPETINLSASGAPAGTTATLSPTSVTTGGSSTLSLGVGTATAPGSYTITITGTSPSATHSTTVSLSVTAAGGLQPVQNGGFETGALSPWAPSGVLRPIVVSGGAHAGTYSARLGSTSPYNGDSILTQTVTIPASGGTLSFWYNPHCPDTITYDQQQAQIRNASGGVLANVLNVCSNSQLWTQKTYAVPPSLWGQSVVLWFNVHDDNWPTDPSSMLLDDVAIN
jgi:hypothetical protein